MIANANSNGTIQLRAKAKAAATANTHKLVTFQLGEDLFAAEVLSVERVLRYAPPKSVPDVPVWIEGVIEHRGTVIPVVDMRRRIELADTAITPETRILVFVTAHGWVAAVVDKVQEVVAVPAESVAPPPALFRGLSSEFVKAIAKIRDQLVVVLDVERVLASSDRIAFERIVNPERREELAVRG
jgi:purine-binding chemotaxis protein CheW